MKKAKKILSLLLATALILASLLSFAGCGKNPVAYLVIEGYGLVAIELYKHEAPITVAHFTKLVKEGYYDGLAFHRIIESFMIQGGSGGAKTESIQGAFYQNGVPTGIEHVEGTVSMARLGHPYESYYNQGYINLSYADLEPYYNSASAQFFIVTETSVSNTRSLDGLYAAFGQVIEGMEHVKAIAKVATDASDAPLTPITITTITFDRAKAEAALNK